MSTTIAYPERYLEMKILANTSIQLTLIPVFVASRTASSNLSYLGLKVIVKAQSMIRPGYIQMHNVRSTYNTINTI